MVNKYSYDPFGNIAANSIENVQQPFKFVGQHGVMTEPNGFYYMRARYYDPSVGRFISEDPKGFDDGDGIPNFLDPDSPYCKGSSCKPTKPTEPDEPQCVSS